MENLTINEIIELLKTKLENKNLERIDFLEKQLEKEKERNIKQLQKVKEVYEKQLNHYKKLYEDLKEELK